MKTITGGIQKIYDFLNINVIICDDIRDFPVALYVGTKNGKPYVFYDRLGVILNSDELENFKRDGIQASNFINEKIYKIDNAMMPIYKKFYEEYKKMYPDGSGKHTAYKYNKIFCAWIMKWENK